MVLSSQHTYSNKSSSLSDKYQVASDRWIKPIDSGHLTMQSCTDQLVKFRNYWDIQNTNYRK